MRTKPFQRLAPFALLSAIAFTGCQSSAPKSKKAPAIHPSAPAAYTPGHDLYMAKCGTCHRLHALNEFTVAEWHPILNSMAPMAKLSPAQKDAVFAYIASGAAH